MIYRVAEQADPNDSKAVDRRLVAEQIGREPRAMQDVAVRCPYGVPAVTHQAPADDAGNPFPTAFYLTCPHLVRQIDRIESGGGVRRFEAALAEDEGLRAATLDAHLRHSLLDERGVNIAGTTNPERVKCLHAHAAFALATGEHPLGQRVLREASPRWCDDAHCRQPRD